MNPNGHESIQLLTDGAFDKKIWHARQRLEQRHDLGIRIGKPNRDRYFQRDWTEIEVELDGQFHRFPLTGGFWNKCPEFRTPIIRESLKRHGMLKWAKGTPPNLELTPAGRQPLSTLGLGDDS